MRWPVWVAILLCVPVALAKEPTLDADEQAWLEAHGPIRYAPDPSYPPFEWLDEDGAHGINVDFLERMSRNLGFEYEVVRYDSWGEVLEAKQRGEVDLLGSLARNPERETYLDFIGPYARVGEVFYVRSDSPFMSEADLVGAQIGVISGYAASTWLAENRPELTLVEVADMEEGLSRLSVGELDAFFENIPVGGYVIRELAFSNIRILGSPLYYSDANWGVTKDEAILLSIIGKGMESISEGEQTRIFEYWTGYDLGVATARDPGLSVAAQLLFAGIAVVAVSAILWVVVLRGAVARRSTQVAEGERALAETTETLHGEQERRSRAEKDVQALNERLQQELAHRGDQLAGALGELDAVSSRLAQEIRGPLEEAARVARALHQQNAGVLGVSGQKQMDALRNQLEKAEATLARLLESVDRKDPL